MNIEKHYHHDWYDRPLSGLVLMDGLWYWYTDSSDHGWDDCMWEVYKLEPSIEKYLAERIASWEGYVDRTKWNWDCIDLPLLDICIYKELDTKDFLRVQDRHTKIGHTDLNEFFPIESEKDVDTPI
jgi:hypothetical protein